MRRQFQLAEEDETCLTARSPNWEALIENNTKWAIIPDFAVPEGYNHRAASAAFRISPSYPDDQIDMVYFYPALALTNGRGNQAAHAMPDRRKAVSAVVQTPAAWRMAPRYR